MQGIIGRKLGMTSIFDEDTGSLLSCTIIQAGPCVVTQVKSVDTDGYSALQLAYEDKKDTRVRRAEKGHFLKSGAPVKRIIREFRNFDAPKQLGEQVDLTIFQEGDKVEVVGTTKGKGFQGVVKRHGFRGVGEASHGQHDRQRAPGSVGGSSFPSRVFKGLRMAGQTGGNRVKVKGLTVLKVFPDKHYLLVKGAVPGFNGGIVLVQK